MPRNAPMLCAGALIAVTIATSGSISAAGAQTQALRSSLRGLVATGAPGAILLTRQAGHTTRLGVGRNDLQRRSRLGAGDSFRIGSLTKTFVASVVLQLASDPGFHSTAAIAESRSVDESLTVQAQTLDQVWLRAHAPNVSFVKVDTEGSEHAVLRGAEQILRTCQPVLLVEAKGRERLRELDSWLGGFGYSRRRQRGFAPGNVAYTA